MTERYVLECVTCGPIVADTDDGLFSLETAHRRAGFHEGVHSTPEHLCDVCRVDGLSRAEPIRIRTPSESEAIR